MNIFEGVEINIQFLGPLIVLLVTMSGTALLYSLFFRWLPKEIYKFLWGIAALFGVYIWYDPMNMGFYEYFKHWGV